MNEVGVKETEMQQKHKVLIVEGDKATRESFQLLFQSMNGVCNSDFVSNPPEALEKLSQAKDQGKPFDCVFSELDFNGLRGGFDFAKAVKQEQLAPHFILVTARLEEVMAIPESERQALGVKAVMGKPNVTRDGITKFIETARREICEVPAAV